MDWDAFASKTSDRKNSQSWIPILVIHTRGNQAGISMRFQLTEQWRSCLRRFFCLSAGCAHALSDQRLGRNQTEFAILRLSVECDWVQFESQNRDAEARAIKLISTFPRTIWAGLSRCLKTLADTQVASTDSGLCDLSHSASFVFLIWAQRGKKKGLAPDRLDSPYVSLLIVPSKLDRGYPGQSSWIQYNNQAVEVLVMPAACAGRGCWLH
jgi:hypothetical protein